MKNDMPSFLIMQLNDAIQELQDKYAPDEVKVALDEWYSDDEGYFFIPIYVNGKPLLKFWAYSDTDCGEWEIAPNDHSYKCVNEYIFNILDIENEKIISNFLAMASEIDRLRSSHTRNKSETATTSKSMSNENNNYTSRELHEDSLGGKCRIISMIPGANAKDVCAGDALWFYCSSIEDAFLQMGLIAYVDYNFQDIFKYAKELLSKDDKIDETQWFCVCK